MSIVFNIARAVPGGVHLYRSLRRHYDRYLLRKKTPAQVFTEIFAHNGWSGDESVSGLGSSLSQTQVLIDTLPGLFKEHGVRTVLDAPCGDFHWMRKVDLTDINYLGADIVADVVERNKKHERPGVRFQHLDLIKDKLPQVDLIFCRDCLVHFSYHDLKAALDNIRKSGSTYLLTTTFPGRERNTNIATGEWRPLNLMAAPFHFPPPLVMINEKCTEADGMFADKSMGLWKIADLRK
ncbi:class I SAM-dependent methyltransferase [Sphaerotilaceae bacterium SBD11-9]